VADEEVTKESIIIEGEVSEDLLSEPNRDFETIVIAWLLVLTLAWVGVIIFWRPICNSAARTVLLNVQEELAREFTNY